MDSATLRAEIERAASPTGEALKSARAKYARLPAEAIEGFVIHDLAEPIFEKMQADPELKGLMIRHGNGATNFCYSATRHVVRLALNGELDAAIAWFQKVRAMKSAEVLEILPLWGLEVHDSTQLVGNVDLIPFDSLPTSTQKEAIRAPDMGVGHRPLYAWSPPTAALIAKWKVSPLFYQGDVDAGILQAGDVNLLRHVRACLTLIRPSSVLPAISWFQYDDTDLNFSLLGAGYSIPFMESQPRAITKFGEFSPSEAQQLIPKYLSLGGEVRARIERAIDRFDRAMRRHEAGDAAVELATALESVLSDGPGELLWKIGLRSALLVESSKERKVEVRKIVRGLYWLRSQVVHKGSAENEIDVRGLGRMSKEMLISKSAIVVASVLKSTIRKGELPDWFEAEIGY